MIGLGAACNKETTGTDPKPPSCEGAATTRDEASKRIIGRWKWEQTYTYLRGMAGPEVKTPASTGEERELVFTADNTMQVLVNGKQTESRKFQLNGQGTDPVLLFSSRLASESTFGGGVLLQLCPSQLILNAQYNDSGGITSYRRVP